ncbi:MAG TPA: ImmA/IrrE family metallo-endopeptidase [Candidatus Brocadiia bacterium]|nr:ImmA/IrrE family metallo-endopeptidase [Planctomycetota bacterium]MDO8092242.1 ImmA/IrrE family metallo-endopeptidase [Candidatus Brocadiales bacterium]
MVAEIKVPFINHDQIKNFAEDFLQKYHPEDIIPIPIEEIIDLKLKLDIIPVPGLHNLIDTDGFITSDLTSIFVEDYVYQNRPCRYRFTLAHEIGHFVLHKDIYIQHKFNSIDGWMSFIDFFPEKERSLFEWQANEFAGLILVPSRHLEKRLRYNIKRIKEIGIQNKNIIFDQTVELLAQDFVVSREVIQRRIKRELEKGTIKIVF